MVWQGWIVNGHRLQLWIKNLHFSLSSCCCVALHWFKGGARAAGIQPRPKAECEGSAFHGCGALVRKPQDEPDGVARLVGIVNGHGLQL